MSKQFAMLTATRRLDNYLSRERYNLNRMKDNERVPYSLFETKVNHYNELVSALNDLFGALAESTELLFEPYELEPTSDEEFTVSTPSSYDSSVDEAVSEPEYRGEVSARTEPELKRDFGFDEDNTDDEGNVGDIDDDENENEDENLEQWQRDGYLSYEAWLVDKEAENVEIPDDLSVGLNTSLSRYRADKALSDYSSTSEHDIAEYNPEDDKPVSVLPSDDNQGDDEHERPTADLRYLNHTADNVRVDNDPTQIASVKTAVELDGERARRGADIDVLNYVYQTDKVVKINDILDDEIKKLAVNQEHTTDEDGFPVDDEDESYHDEDEEDIEEHVIDGDIDDFRDIGRMDTDEFKDEDAPDFEESEASEDNVEYEGNR